MKVTVSIKITDHTSEEELIAKGLSTKFLHNLYKDAFANILGSVATNEIKTELSVRVTDNTKEEK